MMRAWATEASWPGGSRRAACVPPGCPWPNALQRRKRAEVDRLLAEGRDRIGRLRQREFLLAGVALYEGEGSKGDGRLRFANSDPRMIVVFCTWLRRFFEIDESHRSATPSMCTAA
jgi:hypothetical protein